MKSFFQCFILKQVLDVIIESKYLVSLSKGKHSSVSYHYLHKPQKGLERMSHFIILKDKHKQAFVLIKEIFPVGL